MKAARRFAALAALILLAACAATPVSVGPAVDQPGVMLTYAPGMEGVGPPYQSRDIPAHGADQRGEWGTFLCGDFSRPACITTWTVIGVGLAMWIDHDRTKDSTPCEEVTKTVDGDVVYHKGCP